MAVSRSNPLAPGVYWIDVWRPSPARPRTRDGEPIMQDWLAKNRATVQTVKRTTHEDGALKTAPYRVWHLFQVVGKPGPFPSLALGFPTIVQLGQPAQIPPSALSVESPDTARTPPPEPLFDLSIFTATATGPLLIALGLYLLTSRK